MEPHLAVADFTPTRSNINLKISYKVTDTIVGQAPDILVPTNQNISCDRIPFIVNRDMLDEICGAVYVYTQS